MPLGTRLLFIGLDAADPDRLDAYLAAGVAPNLKALRASSRRARIVNYEGMGAGAFWPSAATGVHPGEHGRCFRLQFDPKTYDVSFRDDSADFPVDSIWRRLSLEGLKLGVIDWPHAPVHAIDGGFILDNWLSHDPTSGPRSFPESVAEEAMRLYGADPWGGGVHEKVPASAAEWRDFVSASRARIALKTRYCVDRLQAEEFDLFAAGFSDLHDVGHYGLHLTDPSHYAYDAALAAAVGDPMQAVVEALDEAVAAVIRAAGRDAAIVALGGPGMEPMVTGNPTMELIAQRLDLGAKGAALATERARRAWRSFAPPSLRQALSPATRLVLRRPPHRSENAGRRFFAVPHTHNSGAIRINLKGREAFGVVEPGPEFEALTDALIRDLSDLRDPESGARVVEKVVPVKRLYDGPAADALPDLFVVWRRERPFARVASPKIGVVENSHVVRTGDHTAYGFFWTKGLAVGLPDTISPHDVGLAAIAACEELAQPAAAEIAS
jgi:predicted AlkP superfamily phosphohydrolase/phosphomutase